jgi:hypothetical protein
MTTQNTIEENKQIAVIYQDKNTVFQITCLAAKRLQRIDPLT